jgi:hypothetical protein
VASTAGLAVVGALRKQMDGLGQAVADLDEASTSKRAADGGWSVKEHLSHLYGADGDTFLDSVRRFFDEDTPVIEVEPGVTHFDASRKAMPVGDLVVRVQAQYRAIADLLAAASADELARRGHIALLAQSPFGDHPTLAEWVEVMSTMHVARHLDDLLRRR